MQMRRIAILSAIVVSGACADSTSPPPVRQGNMHQPAITTVADVDATARAPIGVERVEAYVDGRSQLTFTAGGVVQWEHFEFAAPGRLNFATLPTRFNDFAWYPDWPDVPDAENRDCFCRSRLLYLQTAIPYPADYDIPVRVISSRGTTSVIQQPRSSNGGAFIVQFDDNAPIGADWYKVELDFRFGVEGYIVPAMPINGVSRSKGGFVKWAVLTTPSRRFFDVQGVDVNSLTLGDDVGRETPVARASGGGPLVRILDVNHDGFDDLVAEFAVPELVTNGDLALGVRQLHLNATYNSAYRITATDRVRVLP
jgi:hypothetical protein